MNIRGPPAWTASITICLVGGNTAWEMKKKPPLEKLEEKLHHWQSCVWVHAVHVLKASLLFITAMHERKLMLTYCRETSAGLNCTWERIMRQFRQWKHFSDSSQEYFSHLQRLQTFRRLGEPAESLETFTFLLQGMLTGWQNTENDKRQISLKVAWPSCD